MANKFTEHAKNNSEIYFNLLKNGYISEDDIKTASNKSGEVSFKDQDAALQRINDGIIKAIEKNPNLKDQLTSFYEGTPKVEKFTPNKKDWRDYNQEQMGRLAESMHFNWKNKDDRSVMMNQLMNESIRDDKKKIYEDYKKEHPIAAFINENIIAPNVSQRSKKGEDITNTDVALDLANVGTLMFPGGIGKTPLQKGLSFAADAALQGAVGVASDLNQGNELGAHNIYNPLFGAVLGASTEYVPGLVKYLSNKISTPGGRSTKGLMDKVEDAVTDVFTDAAETSKKSIDNAAEAATKETKIYKNATEEQINLAKKENKPIEANASEIQYMKDRKYYTDHPEKWEAHKKNMSVDEYNKFAKDKEFMTALKNAGKKKSKVSEVFGTPKKGAQSIAKGVGRGSIVSNANDNRAKEASTKERQDAEDEQWYIDHYSRFWDAGFAPHGPDSDPSVKAYKKYIKTKDVFGK